MRKVVNNTIVIFCILVGWFFGVDGLISRLNNHAYNEIYYMISVIGITILFFIIECIVVFLKRYFKKS